MADSTTMTVGLPVQLRDKLDQLAEATERSKSWLAADAIRAYVELQEWQIMEIKAGIREADAGDFASDGEVNAVMKKWRRDAD